MRIGLSLLLLTLSGLQTWTNGKSWDNCKIGTSSQLRVYRQLHAHWCLCAWECLMGRVVQAVHMCCCGARCEECQHDVCQGYVNHGLGQEQPCQLNLEGQLWRTFRMSCFRVVAAG